MASTPPVSLRERLWRAATGVHGRISALTVVIAAAGAALYTTTIVRTGMTGAPLAIPWILLAVGFAVSELSVVHIEVRRDAHSVSLNEIPLVIALVFVTPGHLLFAHLAAATVVFAVHRRQAMLKLAFNLSHILLEDAAALLVFHAVTAHHLHLGPRLWLAATAATLTATTASVVTVNGVIALHQRRMVIKHLVEVAGVSFTGALFNSCLALVAVTVLWVDARGAVLLLVIGAILVRTYGAYASLHQRHAGLELLYQFTQAIRGSGDAEDIVADVLSQARAMLRAEVAELAILPVGGLEGIDWLVLQGDSEVALHTLEPCLHPSLANLVEAGRPVVGAKTSQDPRVRAHLSQRGQRDCIVAPLVAEGQLIGILAVANRLGDVNTFDQEDGRLFETLAAHTSMTLQNARLVDRLRHDSLHDSLTGLANRVLFQRLLADVLDRRRPTDPEIGVMLIDLDRFKEINDTLGHATGDLLLQEVAGRLRRSVPSRVTVARLGGDEFALLDPEQAGLESALALARSLTEDLGRPFAYQDLELEVSATIGVAVAPAHGRDPTTLLRRADVAMYAAKRSGVGVSAYGADLDEHSPRRLGLVSELRSVIELGGLQVYYQPQAELATGRVIGVEALVRWPHRVEGMIPPDEFIPLAERVGLIGQLTDHVLGVALHQARLWDEAGHALSVAVNLSARSLLDATLVEDIARALDVAGVEPSRLVLEITESSVMSDAGYAMNVLARLSSMGVRLAIDDFGTGYSSLSYLKRLPVNEVKIDKSFVLNMQEDDNDAVIVRSIVDLGKNLGLRVVAEGVETAIAWNALKEMGCDVAQGYILSRPIPAAQLDAWLETVMPVPVGVGRSHGPRSSG